MAICIYCPHALEAIAVYFHHLLKILYSSPSHKLKKQSDIFFYEMGMFMCPKCPQIDILSILSMEIDTDYYFDYCCEV